MLCLHRSLKWKACKTLACFSGQAQFATTPLKSGDKQASSWRHTSFHTGRTDTSLDNCGLHISNMVQVLTLLSCDFKIVQLLFCSLLCSSSDDSCRNLHSWFQCLRFIFFLHSFHPNVSPMRLTRFCIARIFEDAFTMQN